MDAEVITVLATYDESKSLFAAENAGKEQMHRTVNGYAYASAPEPVEVVQGERVRWIAGATGTNDEDLHTMHWHGQTGVTPSGERTDAISVLPGELKQLDFMVRGEATEWLLHCHVSEHTEEGMSALVRVVEGRDPGYNDDPRPEAKDARALHLGAVGAVVGAVGALGIFYMRTGTKKLYRKTRSADLEQLQDK